VGHTPPCPLKRKQLAPDVHGSFVERTMSYWIESGLSLLPSPITRLTSASSLIESMLSINGVIVAGTIRCSIRAHETILFREKSGMIGCRSF
jgi:hypothetical protein